MKKVKTLSELVSGIEGQFDIYELINGTPYKCDPIRLLQKPLITFINQIKDGKLLIDYEY